MNNLEGLKYTRWWLALIAMGVVTGLAVGVSPCRADRSKPSRPQISWIRPVDAKPGEAVLLDVSGLQRDFQGHPIQVFVSLEDLKLPATVLDATDNRIVIRLPRNLPEGTGKLRVHQDDRRSKPRLIQVSSLDLKQPIQNVVGGLAFLLLGLTALAKALRRLSGRGLRGQLSAMTKDSVRSSLSGVAVGVAAQSATASAGVVVGLLRAQLISGSAAVGVLVGAHLGATTAGTLLPLFAGQQALWLVAAGALWMSIAKTRWNRALGQMVLAAGTLFVGMSFVQDGLRPLLSEPALLPVIAKLGGSQPSVAMLSIGLGAALSMLLQGPGPAFATVVAMTQVTTLLSGQDSLRILSGVALGSCVTIAVVALPLGAPGRRLTLTGVLFGLVALPITWYGAPVFVEAARTLLGDNSNSISYGTPILRPNVAAHLGLAFVLSQLVATVVAVPLIPAFTRLCERWMPGTTRTAVTSGSAPTLVPVLNACRRAILSIGEVVTTRDRQPAIRAEAAIEQARFAIKGMLEQIATVPPEVGLPDVQALTVCLHLATATDGALRVAERALERNLPVRPDDARRLADAHGLLTEGLEAIVNHLSTGTVLSRQSVQAREIRLNALEAEARETPATAHALAENVWMKELASAWESVGNQVFRLGNTLASEEVSH